MELPLFVTSCLLPHCSGDTMGKCTGLVNPQAQPQALSQAAILLRERMRKAGAGITGYDQLKDTGELLVHLGSSSLLCSSSGKVNCKSNYYLLFYM